MRDLCSKISNREKRRDAVRMCSTGGEQEEFLDYPKNIYPIRWTNPDEFQGRQKRKSRKKKQGIGPPTTVERRATTAKPWEKASEDERNLLRDCGMVPVPDKPALRAPTPVEWKELEPEVAEMCRLGKERQVWKALESMGLQISAAQHFALPVRSISSSTAY